MTVTQVMGCGNQHGWKEYYRGTEVLLNMVPKVRFESWSTMTGGGDRWSSSGETARTGAGRRREDLRSRRRGSRPHPHRRVGRQRALTGKPPRGCAGSVCPHPDAAGETTEGPGAICAPGPSPSLESGAMRPVAIGVEGLFDLVEPRCGKYNANESVCEPPRSRRGRKRRGRPGEEGASRPCPWLRGPRPRSPRRWRWPDGSPRAARP